ncbi:unnamed protein product, partial [marine sediment metagenome]
EKEKKAAPGNPLLPAGSKTFNQEKEEKKAQKKATPENPPHPAGMETLKTASWKSPVLNTPPQTGISTSPEGRKEKLVEGKSVHVELAFDNADLYEVLDATLYELFKVNYMLDPSIKAKVTFHISGDYTRSQFVNILNNVLQLNKIAIVKGPGDIFKIVRRPMSAGVANAPLVTGGENVVGDITRMIRLRYLSAAKALGNVRPFLSTGAVLTLNTMNNSLVITDTPDNVAKAASILGALDVPYFSDISWRLFPVKE